MIPAIANAAIVIDGVPLLRTPACPTAVPSGSAAALRVSVALCELPLSRGSLRVCTPGDFVSKGILES